MNLLPKKKQQVSAQDIDGGLTVEKNNENPFASAIKRTKFDEFVRFKLNYRIVTTLSWFNLVVLFPIGLFCWLMNLFGLFELAILNYLPWYLFIPLWFLPYLTWHYSTITIPKKKGKVILGDWSKTKKGRWKAALFNLLPFHILSWCAAAKYVVENFLDYLVSVRLHEPYKNIILTDDLDSLVLILFVGPILFSAIAIFLQVRDYMINKDLLSNHFMDWQAPYFKRYAHEYQLDTADVIVGYELDTKKPIIIKESERFLHEGVFGATGSGKTSTTLLLRIAQDLIKIATGERKMSLIFLEPKGDGVDDVLKMCEKLGVPKEKIKVIDPTKSWSMKYNPFSGNRDSAAASFQGTLNALTGDQDPFFKGQQEETASLYTLLAKIRYGNSTNILHLQKMYLDARYLADIVENVRLLIDRSREDKDLTPEKKVELDAFDQVVSYFENDVLDYKTFRQQEEIRPVLYPNDHKYAGRQMVESKKEKYITGAKKYLNEIALNSMLKSLFVCNEGEEPFDADEFLKEGGVLLVNTALGDLDELSLLFGQFFIRQFQSAIFRRAKESDETGEERIPTFFYIDEFPLFANESFERILTLARSYKVGAIIAMQSIAQLDAVGLAYRKSILGNASHKTVFGRGPVEDNEYFSAEFGEQIIVEESMNESGSPMTSENQVWGYRLNTQKKLVPRFTPTDIRELPFKQMIVQVVDESNSIGAPKRAIGEFVHESKLVQRFMKLVEQDLKSTEEKDFNYTSMIKDKSILTTMSKNIEEAHKQQPKVETVDKILDLTNMHSVLPKQAMDGLNAINEQVQKVLMENEEREYSVLREEPQPAASSTIPEPVPNEHPYKDPYIPLFMDASISSYRADSSPEDETSLPLGNEVHSEEQSYPIEDTFDEYEEENANDWNKLLGIGNESSSAVANEHSSMDFPFSEQTDEQCEIATTIEDNLLTTQSEELMGDSEPSIPVFPSSATTIKDFNSTLELAPPSVVTSKEDPIPEVESTPIKSSKTTSEQKHRRRGVPAQAKVITKPSSKNQLKLFPDDLNGDEKQKVKEAKSNTVVSNVPPSELPPILSQEKREKSIPGVHQPTNDEVIIDDI